MRGVGETLPVWSAGKGPPNKSLRPSLKLTLRIPPIERSERRAPGLAERGWGHEKILI